MTESIARTTVARTTSVSGLLAEIADIGTDSARGGYSRPVYSAAELELREWFIAAARARSLDIEQDRNGIIWAWWNPGRLPLADAVVTGSHLDSVPGGGAFDGPLGVASALAAIDSLQAGSVMPERPLALAVFPEEEGSRYGLACLGSQLMTGAVTPQRAAALTDADGTTFADLAARNGLDPTGMGRDDKRLSQIGCFVELHVEQGRGLIDQRRAIAIGSSILGHGRWRLSFSGQGNHAGTTLMDGRRDPMLAAAATVLDVRRLGRAVDGARATVGKLDPIPGGSNVIASRVDVWLDIRHSDDAVVAALVADIAAVAREHAGAEGCSMTLTEASMSPRVDFHPGLRGRLSDILPDAPILPTGAGHDAGVLKEEIPTAMLFVRNPTGISHSPEEYVEDPDADAGGDALATVLANLLTQP